MLQVITPVITMTPKHVVFKKVSRDKSVSSAQMDSGYSSRSKRIMGRFLCFYHCSFLEQGTEEACDPSVFQVAVYMAKRDFVDHCDTVDPVGESGFFQTAG